MRTWRPGRVRAHVQPGTRREGSHGSICEETAGPAGPQHPRKRSTLSRNAPEVLLPSVKMATALAMRRRGCVCATS